MEEKKKEGVTLLREERRRLKIYRLKVPGECRNRTHPYPAGLGVTSNTL